MKKDDLLATLKVFKQRNQDKYAIKELGLFGSVAIGDNSEESDIDIVIKTEEANLFLLVHLKEELEKLLHKKVDIVRYRKRMNPFLKRHIDEEAIYV